MYVSWMQRGIQLGNFLPTCDDPQAVLPFVSLLLLWALGTPVRMHAGPTDIGAERYAVGPRAKACDLTVGS